MLKKILFIIILFSYHTYLYSKDTKFDNFNYKYLSNYLSALISYNNGESKKALKYINSSKKIIQMNQNFFKTYLISMIENGQIKRAVKEIRNNSKKGTDNFFEAKLLLSIDEIKNKDYLKAKFHLNQIKKLESNTEFDTFNSLVIDTLDSYLTLFITLKASKTENNYGKLDHIYNSFQSCYLGLEDTFSNFQSLINSNEGDYSRYLFFHLSNNLEKENYYLAEQIIKSINPLDANLLVAQSKKWFESGDLYKFSKIFSCQNENHILAEFLYLVSNLYSSQQDYEYSNFYIRLSNYLNPKFHYNLTLLSENYFLMGDYEKSLKIFSKYTLEDEVYKWYTFKKNAQILSITKSENKALEFIEDKFEIFKNPDIKILYDLANIYKNFKRYDKSINLYSKIINKNGLNKKSLAEIYYRRGSSYERLKNYLMSDRDLIKSLEEEPNDPYVLNYLAYSWLERNYKISRATEMLVEAYELTDNDPFIADSLGWAYYLDGDYLNAEKYIRQAVQLRPNDPVILNHYGDILWSLDRKLQAKYYWKNILDFENTEDVSKEQVNKKIIFGP